MGTLAWTQIGPTGRTGQTGFMGKGKWTVSNGTPRVSGEKIDDGGRRAE